MKTSMIPEIASRATASTNESVQHRQWAVEMTLSIAKKRICGVGRLALEHVEPRARDPSFPKASIRAGSSTIGPRATLMRKAEGFISARRSAFIRCRVCIVEEAGDDDKIRLREKLVEGAELRRPHRGGG